MFPSTKVSTNQTFLAAVLRRLLSKLCQVTGCFPEQSRKAPVSSTLAKKTRVPTVIDDYEHRHCGSRIIDSLESKIATVSEGTGIRGN